MTAGLMADVAQIPMSQHLLAALGRASRYAAEQAQGEVALEHVLLALGEDPDAAGVLTSSNVDLAALNAEVTEHVGRLERRADLAANTPAKLSKDVEQILKAAAFAARGRRREINGAIVLAAIVGEGKSTAARTLQSHGLTFERTIQFLRGGNQAPAQVQAPALAQPPAQATGSAAPVAPPVVAAAVQTPTADIVRPAAPQPAPSPREPGPSGPQSTNEALNTARRNIETRTAPGLSELRVDRPTGAQQMAVGSPPHMPEPQRPDRQPHVSPPHPNSLASGELPDRPTGPPIDPTTGAPTGRQERREPTFGEPTAPPRPPAPQPGPGAYQQSSSISPAPNASGAPRQPTTPGAILPGHAVPLPKPARALAPPPLPPGQDAPLRADGMGRSPMSPHAGPHAQSARPHQPALSAPPYGNRGLQAGASGAPGPPQGGYPAGPNTGGGPAAPSRFPPGPSSSAQGSAGTPPSNAFGPGHPPGFSNRPATAQSASYAPIPQQRGGQVSAAVGGLTPDQIVENIPRSMRLFAPMIVEARIAKAVVSEMAQRLHASRGAVAHGGPLSQAVSLRLRAPNDEFFIETATPETQWIERDSGALSDDFAAWRWTLTPRLTGKSTLQLAVSTRIVAADGMVIDQAAPEHVINVRVRRNWGRITKRLAGFAIALAVGVAAALYGPMLFEAGNGLVQSLMNR